MRRPATRVAHAVGLGERRRVTILKAAEYLHQKLFVDNGVARWVLDTSAATLHDETGLRPMVYRHPLVTRGTQWALRAFGEFTSFAGWGVPHLEYAVGQGHDVKASGETSTAAEETAQLVELLAHSPPLSFPFGYHASAPHHQGAKNGVLMMAWRQALRSRHE